MGIDWVHIQGLPIDKRGLVRRVSFNTARTVTKVQSRVSHPSRHGGFRSDLHRDQPRRRLPPRFAQRADALQRGFFRDLVLGTVGSGANGYELPQGGQLRDRQGKR